MDTLTDRQQAILDFIAAQVGREGLPPTLAEIAREFGFRQPRSAQAHLQALEAKGMLSLLPGKSRGIRLATPPVPDASLALPVLGAVAAGQPIGDAEAEGPLLLDRALFFPRPDYLLRVRGDSMRDDGIFDGDLIAVHRTPEAQDNQIVVARLDGDLTVKRLRRRKDGIQLLPRNPDHAPIEVPSGAVFSIEGVYCGLVRRG
jgi:repressor LexA